MMATSAVFDTSMYRHRDLTIPIQLALYNNKISRQAEFHSLSAGGAYERAVIRGEKCSRNFSQASSFQKYIHINPHRNIYIFHPINSELALPVQYFLCSRLFILVLACKR